MTERKFLPEVICVTAGGGLCGGGNLVTAYLPGAPHWFLGLMFWCGIGAICVPLPSWLIWYLLINHTNCRRITLLLIIGVFWYGVFLIGSRMWGATLQAWMGGPPPPDVVMCLVDTKRPALLLVNNSSGQVAEQIKYAYALFDLDSSTPNEPLHIPVGLFDF